jgi:hypothetical protein
MALLADDFLAPFCCENNVCYAIFFDLAQTYGSKSQTGQLFVPTAGVVVRTVRTLS